MGGPRVVQWSRFSDAWTKLFGIQGSTSLNVVDDVFLTLPSEEELLHLSHLRGWKAFGIAATVPATAGESNRFRVQNPPNSGLIAVVEGFTAIPASAQTFSCGITLNGVLGTVNVPTRDSRQWVNLVGRAPGLLYATDHAAVDVFSGVYTSNLSGSAGTFPNISAIQHVITPGFDFVMQGNTINIAFTGTVWGRYREFTAQEA
jgi:hypothetical protein